MRTHDEFFRSVLNDLSLPVRISGLRALAAVSIFESSQGQNRWFNPFAVTTPWMPGATPYNTFDNNQHVWCYASFDDGVAATAALFAQPHWTDVRTALARWRWRRPILAAFRNAYTWANVDFTVFSTHQLDARRRLELR